MPNQKPDTGIATAPAVPTPVAATRPPPPTKEPATSAPDTGLRLQVGAFREPGRAEHLREALADDFAGVYIVRAQIDGLTWHRVRVGGFRTETELRAGIPALRAAGYRPFVVR